MEGRQAVAELLAAGRRAVDDVWMAAGLDPAPVLDRILELAAGRGVPVRRVSRARLDAEARTEAPQGVLAHADPLPEADLDDLCRGGSGSPPFLLGLDGVEDPHNLGALLRSAEGAGVTGVVVPRHRAAHVTPTVAKVAAGAVERMPMAVVPGLPNALSRAKALGVWIVGLTTHGGDALFDLRLGDLPLMIVLGGEGPGLSRLVAQRCDLLGTIPLHGSLPSLNVGAAGAVALFEVARQRHAARPDRA